MAKMTAKEMSLRAVELYYAEDYDGLEDILSALAVRAPKVHRSTVEHLDSLIHEQSMLDDVGGIDLW